jgi:hypothetical protein
MVMTAAAEDSGNAPRPGLVLAEAAEAAGQDAAR